MPDIKMCKGVAPENILCSMRNSCYRFTAKPSEHRQSYFMAAPVVTEDGQTCEYFWKVESMSQYKRWEIMHEGE